MPRLPFVAPVVLTILLSGCGSSPEARVARADSLYRQGQYANARMEYRKALEAAGSKNPETWLKLARTCVKLAKYDMAYESFQRALALRPDHPEAAEELAALLLPAYWNSGHRAKPLAVELRVLSAVFERTRPSSALAASLHGHLAMGAGQPREAFEHFQAALERKPGDPDAAFMLVRAAFDSMEPTAAESFARRFVAENPSVSPGYFQLARWLDKQGKFAEAEHYRRLRVKALPRDLGARADLAYFLKARGKEDAAREAASELAALGTSEPGARMVLGEYYQKTGDLDSALAVYRAAETESPSEAAVYRKRILSVLLGKGAVAEAKSLLEKIPGHHDDPDYTVARSLLDLDSGDAARVDRAIDQLRQLQGTNTVAALQHGDALRGKLDFSGAQLSYENAVRLVPENLAPRFALMSLLAARSRYKDVIQQADAILAIDPDNRAAALQRIAALRGAGRFEESQGYLSQVRAKNVRAADADLDIEQGFLHVFQARHAEAERVLRRHYVPGYPNVRLVAGLIEALTAQGKFEECRRMLVADLEAKPNRALVLYALGEVQGKTGHLDSAATSFQLAAKLGMAPAHRRFAEVRLEQGKAAEAAEFLRASARQFPSDPQILAVRARAAEVLGDIAEAETCYREWMKLDERNPVPMNNLAYLLAESNRELAEAVRLSSAAWRLAPDNPQFADTLGYAFWRKGENRASLDIYVRLAKTSREAVFSYHYALALSSAGRRSEAHAELESALRRDPGPGLRERILALRAHTRGVGG